MPFKGTGRRENAFKLHARDHIGMFRVTVGVILGGVKGSKTGCQDNGAHFDDSLLRLHGVIYGPGQAGRDTLVAFRADSTSKTPLRLSFYLIFLKAKCHLLEVAFSLFNRDPTHRGTRRVGLPNGIGLLIGPVGFSSFPQIYAI